eukprot:scaffold29066_cov156-Amphora_coffeaeformis.AAC.1
MKITVAALSFLVGSTLAATPSMLRGDDDPASNGDTKLKQIRELRDEMMVDEEVVDPGPQLGIFIEDDNVMVTFLNGNRAGETIKEPTDGYADVGGDTTGPTKGKSGKSPKPAEPECTTLKLAVSGGAGGRFNIRCPTALYDNAIIASAGTPVASTDEGASYAFAVNNEQALLSVQCCLNGFATLAADF